MALRISCFLRRNTLPLSPSLFHAHASAVAAPASSSTSGNQKEKWRWSGILLFIPGLATFGLGTWQLLRRQRKIELLEYRRKRLEDEVVPLNRALEIASSQYQQGDKDAALTPLEFRRVACEGVYDETKSMFLGPRARSHYGVTEKGYFLITPLLPSLDKDASLQVPVLVNRGWVPSSWRDVPPKNKLKEATLKEAPSEENKSSKGLWRFLWGTKGETRKDVRPEVKTTKVVGVTRDSENPNMFVPSNTPESGQWFYVDVPAMARTAGLPENTIYIEAVQEDADARTSNDFPVPKDPNALLHSSVMPSGHLNYAATWYTLSAATTFMAIKRLQNKGPKRT